MGAISVYKKIFIKLLIILILLSTTIVPVKSTTAEEWYEEGNSLYELGEYGQAILAYEKAIEINSNLKEAWFGKGKAFYQLGQPYSAIEFYNTAIGIDPNYREAWVEKGFAHYDREEYEEAIIAFDKAIALDNNFKQAWFGKGKAHEKKGEYEEAIIAFDKAIDLDDNFEKAWFGKGKAHEKKGEYEEAIIAYDKAISIDYYYKDAKDRKQNIIVLFGKIITSSILDTKKIIEIEKANGIDVSEASGLILQAESAFQNSDYILANDLVIESKLLALDVDKDGVLNSEDFAITIPNNIIYGTIAFIFILCLIRTKVEWDKKITIKEGLKKDIERLKKDVEDAFPSSFAPNWCMSTILYHKARKMLDSGEYSKALEITKEAEGFFQKEKPIIELLEKVRGIKKLDNGVSESLINGADDKLRDSNFNEAEKLLKKAESEVLKENKILEDINSIQNKILKTYKSYIIKTPPLIDKCLNELKEGNFDVADSLINQAKDTFTEELEKAKYENAKANLIKDMETSFENAG